MEKKKAILLSIIIFGAIETSISALIVLLVVPDLERLDNLVKSNFFNPALTAIFFTAAFMIGFFQSLWAFKEYKKKNPKQHKFLLYKGIIFSIIILLSLYFFLLYPLEKMVIASY